MSSPMTEVKADDIECGFVNDDLALERMAFLFAGVECFLFAFWPLNRRPNGQQLAVRSANKDRTQTVVEVWDVLNN